MFYRSNLLIHSQKVLWFTEIIASNAKEVYQGFDVEKAKIIALVHDDAEMVTGDIMAAEKSAESILQTAKRKQRELEAISVLCKKFPERAGNYSYRELLLEVLYQSSKESQVVDLADKFDGYGEALHDIFAGNRSLTLPYQQDRETPFEHYPPKLLHILTEILPELRNLNHPMLTPPIKFDIELTLRNGKPHTIDSLSRKTGHKQYDFWKKVIMEKGAVDYLLTQKEF